MRTLKKILTIVLRLGISAALLFLVFRKVDTANLCAILKNAHFADIVAAFLIFLSAYLLCLFRWEMLLKGAEVSLPLRRVIISFGGGVFFNLFMPSTIGGDMVRSIDLAKHTQKPKEVIATVILDRLSGFVGLVMVALIALFFGWKYVREPSVLISLSIISAVLLMLILVIFNHAFYVRINRFLSVPFSSSGSKVPQLMNKLKDGLGKLHQEMHDFKSQKKLIWGNLFMSLLIQLSLPFVFYLLAKALNIEVDLVYFFIFLPIISAITMLPISIGGLGLRDATTIFFFAKAGVAKDMAFAMSLLNFSFILITACAGGIIYVFGVRRRRL